MTQVVREATLTARQVRTRLVSLTPLMVQAIASNMISSSLEKIQVSTQSLQIMEVAQPMRQLDPLV